MHRSVLVDESVHLLLVESNGIYVDATFGNGGHTTAILEKTKKSTVIGIDIDIDVIDSVSRIKSLFGNRFKFVRGDFAKIEFLIREEIGEQFVSGVLLDLGLRTGMLGNPARGFSFKSDAPLDMRFNCDCSRTATDVINSYPQRVLAKILREFGDIPRANMLAKRIVQKRMRKPIKTTTELAEIVSDAFPAKSVNEVLPRVFQAIRIEVNDELLKLQAALEQSIDILRTGGRIVVISYHSAEDRIVKRFFAIESMDCICPPGLPVCRCGHRRTIETITKKPIVPSLNEISQNHRARSAKLRAAQKL